MVKELLDQEKRMQILIKTSDTSQTERMAQKVDAISAGLKHSLERIVSETGQDINLNIGNAKDIMENVL